MSTEARTRDELVGGYESISNWSREGSEEEKGALNAPAVRQLAAWVTRGTSASLGQPVRSVVEGRRNPVSHMLVCGDVAVLNRPSWPRPLARTSSTGGDIVLDRWRSRVWLSRQAVVMVSP